MSDKIAISGTVEVKDGASPTIRRIQASIAKLGAQAKQISAGSGFAKLTQGAKAAQSATMGVVGSMMRLGGSLAAIAGVAGFAGLAMGLQTYINTTDSLAKTSAKVGVTVEQLQQLRYAGEMSGVGADTLDSSLAKLNKNMGEAAAGKNKDLADLMKRLGISMTDAKGRVRSAAEVMPQLSNAFKNNTDVTLRARMAEALFGKQGQETMLMLIGGQAELEKLMAARKELGLIDGEMASRAETANDKIFTMNTAIGMLSSRIYDSLLPAIMPAVEGMTKWAVSAQNWVKENKPVEKGLAELSRLVGMIPWQMIEDGFKTVLGYIKPFWDAIGGLNTVLPVLGALLAGVVAAGLWAVVGALGAMTATLLANPVVLIVAGIALAAMMIYKYWEPISKFFIDLWEKVKVPFVAVHKFMTDFVQNFSEKDIIAGWNTLVGWFSNFWSEVGKVFAVAGRNLLAAFGLTPEDITSAWTSLATWFSSMWTDVKAAFWTAVGWVGDFVGLFSAENIKAGWSGLTTWAGGLWAGVKAKFWEAISWVDEFVAQFVPGGLLGVWDAYVGLFSAIWSKPKAAFDAALAWLDSFVVRFVPGGLLGVWETVTGTISTIWNAPRQAFDAVLDWFSSTFVTGFSPEKVTAVWNGIGAVFTGIWSTAKTAFDDVATWLGTWVLKFIPKPVLDAWNAVAAFFSKLWADIKGVFDTAWAWIEPWVNKVLALLRPVMAGIRMVEGARQFVQDKVSGGVSAAVDATANGAKKVGEAVGNTWDAAKAALGLGNGAAVPATVPAVMGAPMQPLAASVSPVQVAQQNTPPPPTRVEGDIKSTLQVGLAPGLVLNSSSSEERGAVSSSTVDVGTSMVLP